MIPQNRYRLNEYQISKMSDGRLWWTSHTGFAVQISGPCYIYGNVLLMGDRRDYSGMDTSSSSYTPFSAVRWQAIQFDNEPTAFLWTVCGVIS